MHAYRWIKMQMVLMDFHLELQCAVIMPHLLMGIIVAFSLSDMNSSIKTSGSSQTITSPLLSSNIMIIIIQKKRLSLGMIQSSLIKTLNPFLTKNLFQSQSQKKKNLNQNLLIPILIMSQELTSGETERVTNVTIQSQFGDVVQAIIILLQIKIHKTSLHKALKMNHIGILIPVCLEI